MATTLTEDSYSGSVKSPEEMLALWRQVEVDIAQTGAAYSTPNGMTVTMADMASVKDRVAYWERRVLERRGYGGRNTADLTTGMVSDNRTL